MSDINPFPNGLFLIDYDRGAIVFRPADAEATSALDQDWALCRTGDDWFERAKTMCGLLNKMVGASMFDYRPQRIADEKPKER